MRVPPWIWLLGVAGCATGQYVYQPTEQVTGTQEGRPVARYPTPPELPTGDVSIESIGMTEVQPGPNGPKVPVLHVRATVSNNSDEKPWTVDTREQFAVIPGPGKVPPSFANSDAGPGPILSIAKGEQRAFDFFYALPQGMQSPDKIPRFDFLWQVQTSARLVAERTPFERIQVEPQYASYAYPYGGPYVSYSVGFGPAYWGYYDPFWPSVAVVRPYPYFWGYRSYPYLGPRLHYGPGMHYGPRMHVAPRVHIGVPR